MIFRDDRDYERMLKYVATGVERFGLTLHSYCLMPNHFHLLVELTEENLGRGMLVLNGSYARYFNWRHKQEGHVFERKYHREPVLTDEHLLQTIRYIANNPVEADLCTHPAEWRWSSYRATAGLAPVPSWLAVDFVRATCEPYGGYAAFCVQSDCNDVAI